MKNTWKLMVALVLAACMCLAFVSCDLDDITYNGETGESQEIQSDDDTLNNDNSEQSANLNSSGANTEGGWSQLYPPS